MNPLHASENATVYCADSLDVLPGFETESFHLVVTDPPYGQGFRSNQRSEKFDPLDNDGEGDRDVIREVLRESVRLVGQTRHLYVFGPTDVLDGLKVSKPVSVIWNKMMMGGGDLTSRWGPSHEVVRFLVSKHRHAGQSGSVPIGARLRKGTVLSVPRATGRTVRHPTEKPVLLLSEFIESSSNRGERVLDPFGGVGSTGVAAILLGRKATIIEKKLEYAKIAVERIRAAEALYAQGIVL